MTDRDDLRVLAGAAVPGPWVHRSIPATQGWLSSVASEMVCRSTNGIPSGNLARVDDPDTARFIAAASPDAVTGLLDRLDVMEAVLRKLLRAGYGFGDRLLVLDAARVVLTGDEAALIGRLLEGKSV